MLYEMCHTVEEQSSLSLSPFSTAAARLLAALNYSSVTPSCEPANLLVETYLTPTFYQLAAPRGDGDEDEDEEIRW
jgi:hypothetical protein